MALEKIENETQPLKISASELAVAVSYMADLNFAGNDCHSWRVALASERLAALVSDEVRSDVFYAGLLHDIGFVGASKRAVNINSDLTHAARSDQFNHPERGAALLDWIPGMSVASKYIRSHHERWDGSGYPRGSRSDDISLGAQILGLIDAVDLSGAFQSMSNLRHCKTSLAALAGKAWSVDLWSAFVKCTEDAQFVASLMNPTEQRAMVAGRLAELEIPVPFSHQEGAERMFHLSAALVDVKCPDMSGHSLRVGRAARIVAGLIGMPHAQAHDLYRAGLVHDCGRVGVPSDIINRPGRLTDREIGIVRQHARTTIQILGCIPEYRDLTTLGHIAGHHHERHDGAGYPDGLRGDAIPLVSRILAVVDALDAMLSAKSYRIVSPRGAVVRLKQSAGSQFDPEVVDVVIPALENGTLFEEAEIAA